MTGEAASCPVCGEARTRVKLEKVGVAIRECASCGLAFWLPDPGFDPRDVYDASYFADSGAGQGYDDYASLEASLRSTFRKRLSRIGSPGAGARLLDVGAAYGFAVEEAARAGWRAVGVEVSPAAAAQAAARAGERVAVADAAALPFVDGSFDVVTLWDVLEHLPDPHAGVGELSRVLRRGGQVVLTTGDVGSLAARLQGARWHLYTLPEHLFFHTRRSLGILLAAHGLRVVACRAEGATYTLGYLVERLRKTLLGRAADGPQRWPGARLRIPVNLFDILTVRAIRD